VLKKIGKGLWWLGKMVLLSIVIGFGFFLFVVLWLFLAELGIVPTPSPP